MPYYDEDMNMVGDECPCDMCNGRAEPPFIEPDWDAITEEEARYAALEEVAKPEYSCGSNYCDDPACIYPHPEVL